MKMTMNIDGKLSQLSLAEKKKLYILGKLKKEWDLTPKKDRLVADFGTFAYSKKAGEADISDAKYHEWWNECGIKDFFEFERILQILCEDGLISSFEFPDEYI